MVQFSHQPDKYNMCTKERVRVCFKHAVVSTIISGILFALFCTLESICKRSAFYLWRHRWSKKVPVVKESSLSMGGANSFEKCVCSRRWHNVLERKWSKSGVFSFIFSLTFYDVIKKAWYGRNILDYTETSKKNADIIVKTTPLKTKLNHGDKKLKWANVVEQNPGK